MTSSPSSAQRGAQHFEPAPVGQLAVEHRVRLGQRERRRLADRVRPGHAGDPVRGRVPLPHQARLVQHGDAVRAAVDDRPLVGPLPDDLFERHRVGERHPGVPGQQLEQLQLDVAQLAPAVQRVQRAVGLARHVGQAERDGVQAGQRGPDQVVEAARFPGGHHDRLARSHELADQAGGQRRGPAAQPGGQARRADQPQRVLFDDHEAAGVGAGQLAQAGRDAVEDRFQVALGVHVGDHVAEPAHDPGALGHVVPGQVVFAALMADVDPAGHLARAVGQRAGVDPQVDDRAVLADPAGGEGDLAAAADPFQDRVVLGLQLLGDDLRLQADDLGRGPAEHPLGGRVPQHHVAVGAERDDRVGRALDHGPRHRVGARLGPAGSAVT